MVREILGFKNKGFSVDSEVDKLIKDFRVHQDAGLFNMKLGGTLGSLKKKV